MGNQLLTEEKVSRTDIREITPNSVIYHDSDNTSGIELYFADDITDKCYEILSQINVMQNKVFIKRDDKNIYSVSNVNDIHFIHTSTKILPSSTGWYLK